MMHVVGMIKILKFFFKFLVLFFQIVLFCSFMSELALILFQYMS